MSPRMGAVPAVGNHTDEILTDLGYDERRSQGCKNKGSSEPLP